jgi:hypothetical protein
MPVAAGSVPETRSARKTSAAVRCLPTKPGGGESRAPIVRDETNLRERLHKNRLLLGNRQVTNQRQVCPGPGGHPVDRRRHLFLHGADAPDGGIVNLFNNHPKLRGVGW